MEGPVCDQIAQWFILLLWQKKANKMKRIAFASSMAVKHFA
jgi:hypothetical protein